MLRSKESLIIKDLFICRMEGKINLEKIPAKCLGFLKKNVKIDNKEFTSTVITYYLTYLNAQHHRVWAYEWRYLEKLYHIFFVYKMTKSFFYLMKSNLINLRKIICIQIYV